MITNSSAHSPERASAQDQTAGRDAPVADPDTLPDTSENAELVEAIEWLKRAGVVRKNDRPAFAGFFEEVVNSKEGEAEPETED